jgi:ABC-2 type transport system ATP-binding protein
MASPEVSAGLREGLPAMDAVRLDAVTKRFNTLTAVEKLSFSIPECKVFGLLGPNGAGKTTAVRILTTLIKPDAGRALIEGLDVVRDEESVREIIGLAGQSAAIQEELTGRENLEIFGRLHHLSKKRSGQRAEELLERFDLSDAADRPAKTYSGGMQRRLDLASSLVGDPLVLFLDEPTTGLDPRGRIGMWSVIRELVSAGATLLLTTQYLEEADELADEIVVIDHGQVIAAGTSEQLKDRIGGDVIEFVVPDRAKLEEAVRAGMSLSDSEPVVDDQTGLVTLRIGHRGSDALVEAVRALDGAGVPVQGLGLRRPSLDDVFLALTGHAAEDEDDDERAPSRGRRRGAAVGSGEDLA